MPQVIEILSYILTDGAHVKRPQHLPDFENPPLNEVVIGVQFAPAEGYQQIRAGEVWKLFQNEFPKTEEHQPLPPMFETFGLPGSGSPHVSVGIVTGATHDRFWFLSPDADELIQFQHDRLLHNWRKVGEDTNQYPRFEKMITKFKKELKKLEAYFEELSPQKLNINQCEISYINQIKQADNKKAINLDRWIKFTRFGKKSPEEINFSFQHIIKDKDDNAYGKLVCKLNTATSKEGERLLILNLTVRGAPPGTNIEAAMKFLKMGREVIVEYFSEITTPQAHKLWKRTK